MAKDKMREFNQFQQQHQQQQTQQNTFKQQKQETTSDQIEGEYIDFEEVD